MSQNTCRIGFTHLWCEVLPMLPRKRLFPVTLPFFVLGDASV